VKSSAEARCASILRTISSLNAAQGRQPADKIACRHAQPAQHRFSERDEADGERLASSEGQQAASSLFVRFILDLPPLLQTSFPRGVTSAIVASSLFVRTSSQHSQASLRLAPSARRFSRLNFIFRELPLPCAIKINGLRLSEESAQLRRRRCLDSTKPQQL
jgi:hypothetical protein